MSNVTLSEIVQLVATEFGIHERLLRSLHAGRYSRSREDITRGRRAIVWLARRHTMAMDREVARTLRGASNEFIAKAAAVIEKEKRVNMILTRRLAHIERAIDDLHESRFTRLGPMIVKDAAE